MMFKMCLNEMFKESIAERLRLFKPNLTTTKEEKTHLIFSVGANETCYITDQQKHFPGSLQWALTDMHQTNETKSQSEVTKD